MGRDRRGGEESEKGEAGMVKGKRKRGVNR